MTNKNKILCRKIIILGNTMLGNLKGNIYKPLTIEELKLLKRIYRLVSYKSKKGDYNDFDKHAKFLRYIIHTYNPKNFSMKSNLTSGDIKVTLYLLELYKIAKFSFLTPRQRQVIIHELKRLNMKKDKTEKEEKDIKFYNNLLKKHDFNSFFKNPNPYFQKEGR